MKFDEKPIEHPVATGFDSKNQTLMQLTHMSQKSSITTPTKRKIRGAPIGRPDIGLPPPATAKAGEAQIEASYHGGRKPALVLAFQTHHNRYVCMIGEARRIVVINVRQDYWRAFVEQKEQRYSRVQKKLVERWVQFMSGAEAELPARALRHFFNRDGWFYYEGAWRSLSWVYRSITLIGVGAAYQLPKEHPATQTKPAIKNERGLRAGHNLPHVQGWWKWEKDTMPHSVPTLSRALIVRPMNAGLSRTPVNPDVRREMGYIPEDVSHVYKGSYLGGKRVVRYPYRKRSQKDLNSPKPQTVSQAGMGVKVWWEQD